MTDISTHMVTIAGYVVLGVYLAALIFITLFCLSQFHLLYLYETKGRKDADKPCPGKLSGYPLVTIQLPLYNEMYVAERLIDNITRLDYPKDRFEIHILDDSTDETVEIVKRKVRACQADGFRIAHIRRSDREGFKAGALRDGMRYANGEFIAIFDADFLPQRDFLMKTLPCFTDQEVGVVQTRWEHLNESYSLITRLQAFQLNVHFSVEQTGRQAARYFLQFNGTGGIWRRKTIEDAGGWEADTLTEDLDLSIRAQMRGWKIVYREDVGSPAELPAEMNGLKSQQFRWMKGGAETAKKMLPRVWKAPLPLWLKIQTTIHLLSSSIFVFVFLIGLLSVPALFLVDPLGFDQRYFAIFLSGLLTIGAVYYAANARLTWPNDGILKRIIKFLILFPVFLSLSMGMSLHNTVAVIQGYLGKQSPFVRTPKFNISGLADTIRQKKYVARKIPWTTVLEGILSLYFFGAILAGIYFQHTALILFHFLLMIGYASISIYSIRHAQLK